MGTPEFAEPSLQKLHQSSHQIVAVVTGPDKPAGRGRKIQAPPVKSLAQALGYPVLQPTRLKESRFLSHIADMMADILVVVAFRILPDPLLSIPPKGAINLHPSLLPKYRGAAPIQHCLLAGESITGVTTISLTPEVDAGDILMQREVPIYPTDDFGSLADRLAHLGADLLLETLDHLENDQITPQPQSALSMEKPPPAPKITPEDLIIHWNQPAHVIVNQIRAFSPKPGAYSFVQGKRLKLFGAVAQESEGKPGEILGASHNRLRIGTADGILEVAEVQSEGKRRMPVDEFLRGTPLDPGIILGQ